MLTSSGGGHVALLSTTNLSKEAGWYLEACCWCDRVHLPSRNNYEPADQQSWQTWHSRQQHQRKDLTTMWWPVYDPEYITQKGQQPTCIKQAWSYQNLQSNCAILKLGTRLRCQFCFNSSTSFSDNRSVVMCVNSIIVQAVRDCSMSTSPPS